MRILFVSRFKSGFESNLSPIVKSQGDSLVQKGHYVKYYLVEKGAAGYLKLFFNLNKYLKKNSFDIVHSHYSLTSIVSSMALPGRRITVSLMGSDTEHEGIMLWLIRIFSVRYWDKVIVKTEKMKKQVRITKAFVLPNGVDFKKFYPIPKEKAQLKVGFSPLKINILFLADFKRREKNVNLAREAIKLLKSEKIVLHEIYPVIHDLVPYYLNAADVLVLTSLYEGSVNVVKEAMACCIPIVSTDVGDVKENIGATEGCYISSDNPVEFSEKIAQAISFGARTNGRYNIRNLNSEVIAEKLINIYNSTCS